MRDAYLVDAVRTPSGRGKVGGALSKVHPADLLASTLKEIVSRNDLDPAFVEDVITGVVSQIGEQSRNLGRTAVLSAGFPYSVPATTLDRQCGSSQQAATFAAQSIMSGSQDVVIACGVEVMSVVPMGSGRAGRDPHGVLLKRRFPEGLIQQGVSAELIAQRWNLSREELDAFSAESHRRAHEAASGGLFKNELVAVSAEFAGTDHDIAEDETIRPGTTREKLAALPPAFESDEMARRFPEITDWRITPGNSSPLTDGASAALIVSEEAVNRYGLQPRARFHSFGVIGDDPITMLMGITPATRIALDKGNLAVEDIDAFEVNEAFAPVPMAWMKDVGATHDRVNQRGGAIALGHPLGGSGTKLLATLLNTLEATGGKYGLQTMCEGGGMANATIIEALS